MGSDPRRPQRKKKQALNFEQRVFWTALLAGLPGSSVALIILWTGDYTARVQWTLTIFILGFLLGAAAALRGRVVRHPRARARRDEPR